MSWAIRRGRLACSWINADAPPARCRLTRGTTNWKSKCDTLASEESGLSGLQVSLQELSEADHEAKVGAQALHRGQLLFACQSCDEHAS